MSSLSLENVKDLCGNIILVPSTIHPKSEKVCGVGFPVQNILQNKWLNFNNKISRQQGAISCATVRPLVDASAGALTLAGSPSIRAFVAKSVLSQFTRFWMYHFQPQQTCSSREISFVAIYALLGVSFSAIHGDEWLFHDYDASAGLPTLAQGCQR